MAKSSLTNNMKQQNSTNESQGKVNKRYPLNNEESTNYNSEAMTNNKSMAYKGNINSADNQFSEPMPGNSMNSGSNMIDQSRKNFNPGSLNSLGTANKKSLNLS